MLKITSTSRFIGLITLKYGDTAGSCEDRIYNDDMNMWRDVFPDDGREMLLDRKEGEVITLNVDGSDYVPLAYEPSLVVPVRKDRIHTAGNRGGPLKLYAGRYYPQRILKGVPGAFSTGMAPCRLVKFQNGIPIFDLNHPLAGRNLQFSVEIMRIFSEVRGGGGRCEDWLAKTAADGPGMQCFHDADPILSTPPDWNSREDETSDESFYHKPRMVQHLDSTARRIIAAEYGKLAKPAADVLDVMGSWDSHMPPESEMNLTVLGLNRSELEANHRAKSTVVQDLNIRKEMPWEDGSFDMVVCTASIEYVTSPEKVVQEIARVLRPGGRIAVSFSNRWFPTKAIALWSMLHDFEKIGFVRRLLTGSGFENVSSLSVRGYPRPEDDPYTDIAQSDPVYLVFGTKKENNRAAGQGYL